MSYADIDIGAVTRDYAQICIITESSIMGRQSITFTEPNDKWLQAQLDSQEFLSKSEVINDLIRRARERELALIRAKLSKAEHSGISDRKVPEIMQAVEARLKADGQL